MTYHLKKLRVKLEQEMKGEKKENQQQKNPGESKKAGGVTHFLKRQSNHTGGCLPYGGGGKCAIHNTFGGCMQISFPFNSADKQQIQQKLVDKGELHRVEKVLMLVQNKLHPYAPGHQIGATCRTKPILTGTVFLGSARAQLAEKGLEANHDYPVFCGEDGNWWYVGHYRFDEAMDDAGAAANDGEVRALTDAELREEIGEDYVFKMVVQSGEEHAQAWIDALASPTCTWGNSLTTLQMEFKNVASADDVLDDNLRVAWEYLHDEGMLSAKSGTSEQRSAATRHFLSEGILLMYRSHLKFVKFDEKFHRVCQERCAGENSAMWQARLKNKQNRKRKSTKAPSDAAGKRRCGKKKYPKGTTFDKNFKAEGTGIWRGEVVEVNHMRNGHPYRIVWTKENVVWDTEEWIDGAEIAKCENVEDDW